MSVMQHIADLNRTYLLRSCNNDFTAHGGYQWPHVVGAECRPVMWDPEAECGNGLHGFVNGEGDSSLANWGNEAQWIIFSAPSDQVTAIGPQKSKSSVARIEHVGVGGTGSDRRLSCIQYLESIGRLGLMAMGVMRQGGARSTLTGGARSTLTGGARSTLTGGDGSTLTGGGECTMIFRWYDYANARWRLATADETVLKPNTPYTVKDGKIVEVVK
jgi:hypothetical protein